MPQTSIDCSLMRGGTSKGLVVDADELPQERELRDRVLIAAMGGGGRQIDGLGGGHPLTSKVAVVGRSSRPDADVDYLFLQVWPDRAEVSDTQNCGNMLAAVAPFAIDRGLVAVDDGGGDGTAMVRIWMRNTETLATASVETRDGATLYDGATRIDGVPGSHAPVVITFEDIRGSTCGALLPTGNVVDEVEGLRVTCIDNGMPVVCLLATDLGLRGDETPEQIEADTAVTDVVERVRLAAGPLMALGDVAASTVPKMCLVSAPRSGGSIATRTLIPHRVHEAIGVLGAVSVATAAALPGSVAASVSVIGSADGAGAASDGDLDVEVEHPSGFFTVRLVRDPTGDVVGAALVRTARELMRGRAFVPESVWVRS